MLVILFLTLIYSSQVMIGSKVSLDQWNMSDIYVIYRTPDTSYNYTTLSLIQVNYRTMTSLEIGETKKTI